MDVRNRTEVKDLLTDADSLLFITQINVSILANSLMLFLTIKLGELSATGLWQRAL